MLRKTSRSSGKLFLGIGLCLQLVAACGESDQPALPASTAGQAGMTGDTATSSAGTPAPAGTGTSTSASTQTTQTMSSPSTATGSAGTTAQAPMQGPATMSNMGDNAAGSIGAAGSGMQGAAGAAGMSAPATRGAAGASGNCQDTCAVKAGVNWACKLRFMYGVNYAWHNFASDFGGNKAWSQPGISGEPAVEADLRNMAGNGIQVIRWWLWPDFRGDGVTFDGSDTPTGLGGTALADLARALELAEMHDMYLMLTLFSFDNFRPTRMESDLKVRGLSPIATDDKKLRALLDNVIAPLAQAVEQSPYKQRVIAWDMINEPEWAIQGASMYGGDPAFDPMMDFETVTHAQMETFLRELGKGLRANSKALLTVGGAAVKWAHAWSMLDLDFHQFHMYDWVNMYWPYDKSPKDFGLDDKPVVMGEFPLKGLTNVGYDKLLQSWFGNGYAGALGWAYTDAMFNSGDYAPVKAFADAHPCETRY